MTDPAVKTALTLCVLVAGAFSALLFRHHRPRPPPPNIYTEEEVLLRYRADAAVRSRRADRSSSVRTNASEASTSPRPATVVTPLDRHEPPPSLAPDYPETHRPASSHWGVPMEMMLPQTPPSDDVTRTHTVVDGDTLPALAERYLGSAARAREIYQLNRDVLPDPELLPIGVELKLPPREGRATSAAAPASPATPSDPLAPVR